VSGEATGQLGSSYTGALAAREERRRARRVKIELAARLKPYYQSHHLPPETRPTLNISKDGIYFATRRDGYTVGMHVLVTCPHTEAGRDAEGDLARVVRVEPRDEKHWGVALNFVRSIGYHRNSAGPSVI
jgi:hypothetical protein